MHADSDNLLRNMFMNQKFINDELKKNLFVKKWTSGVGRNGRNGIVTFLARKATCFCKVQCITVSFENKLQTNFAV